MILCSQHLYMHCNTILQTKWLALLHHVVGDHEWATGKCEHDHMESDNKTPLERTSKAMEVLRNIVMNPLLLEDFPYYVHFR